MTVRQYLEQKLAVNNPLAWINRTSRWVLADRSILLPMNVIVLKNPDWRSYKVNFLKLRREEAPI